MSNFNNALKHVLANEGGYANISGDTGGQTYQGISRNNWPNWSGWSIIDKNMPLRYNQILENKDLEEVVASFYYTNFWDRMKLSSVSSQEVARKIFDMGVNMGTSRAIKLTQEVLRGLVVDGIIGSKTIKAINNEGEDLLDQLRTRCIKFYTDLAERRPSNRKFLNGWLRRARQ